MVHMVAVSESARGLPVAPSGGQEWTVEMLKLLPDDGLRYEIVDGILFVSPAPRLTHQRALGRLYRILGDSCPDDHEVFVAPLDWQPDGRTSLEPDVLVVAKDRLGELNITETPTLVVEVLSPSSSRYDRLLKFSRYAEAGIRQYWIVDPRKPSIEVHDIDEHGNYQLTAHAAGDESLTVAAPLTVTVSPSSLVSG
jgi:Uma2 family endonuclease